jgi:hypothetical protein
VAGVAGDDIGGGGVFERARRRANWLESDPNGSSQFRPGASVRAQTDPISFLLIFYDF